jgi:hypothetical protein
MRRGAVIAAVIAALVAGGCGGGSSGGSADSVATGPGRAPVVPAPKETRRSVPPPAAVEPDRDASEITYGPQPGELLELKRSLASHKR